MSSFGERVIGALQADVRIFEEIEADQQALPQALLVVGATVVATGLGALGKGVVAGLLGSLIGWVVGAAIIYFLGVHVMPEPTTKSNLPELMRVLGFASAPGLFQVLRLIPFLGWLLAFAAAVWGLYVYVIAVRQALDYQSTGRAVAVCVIAFIIQFTILCGFTLLMVGAAALGGAALGAAS